MSGRLAQAEDENSWLLFLSELEALGVRGDNGLELLIHAGGSGLCAALRTVHFAASKQRCLFHKLRNLYNAIRLTDEGLTLQAKRQRRKAIFRDSTTSGRPSVSPPCSSAIATSSVTIA